jgi:hypothetical protein
MNWSKLVQRGLIGSVVLVGLFANSAMAQRSPLLADSQEPGSVIVFPKFVRGFVTVDGVPAPRTEFELGVVCPRGVTCPERQLIKIRFHYVCGGDQNPFNKFICQEVDFDATVTVNGKLVFNTEATMQFGGNFISPNPPCERGYLIAWVVNTSDQPIKFDGLIGDAVIRESSSAVSAYNAIPIQAHPTVPGPGGLITLGPLGQLIFDGAPGHYQAVTGRIFGDVSYDRRVAVAPLTTLRSTFLTLLTLDVRSNRPNFPTFVDIDFYNVNEALLSTFVDFICWREVELSVLNPNLTEVGMGSRKGVFKTDAAFKEPIFGVFDDDGPVTLLGIVTTLEGPLGSEREYSYGVFNDSKPIRTIFFP